MTFRITLGIDPGNSGAIAVLADGKPQSFIDTPTLPRKTSGFEVNWPTLAAQVRDAVQRYSGAHVFAVLEQVNAMPSTAGPDGTRRQMGASTSFKFGESFGGMKAMLGTLGIGYMLAFPATWKRHHGLAGADKDCSRLLVLQRFPGLAQQLARKKDVGRADAVLIGRWAWETEQAAQQAAA